MLIISHFGMNYSLFSTSIFHLNIIKQIIGKMSSTLKNISMFPFQNFWNMKGQKTVSHSCGGVLTLLAFIIIGAITCFELYLVFDRSTITTSVQTEIDFSPPLTNLSTFQNDPTTEPFMMAIDLKDGPDRSVRAQGYYVYAHYATRFFNKTSENYQSITTQIKLENCSALHFATLPNITKNVANWGIDTWYCLPLNKTYQIGGNEIESSKQLRFGVACINSSNSACTSTINMAMQVNLHTLNTFINPQNHSTPFLTYLSSKKSVFSTKLYTRNYVNIDKNQLATDSSLTPLSSITSHSSYEISNDFNTIKFNHQNPVTQFFILRSSRTTTSNRSYLQLLTALSFVGGLVRSSKTTTSSRSYLKLLTALSFVGGLVAPIIGFFSLLFLTSNFGSLVFEMKFAKNYFNDKVARIANDIHYFRFLKQAFYRFLGRIGCKPEWEIIQKTDEIIKTVNHLMDIVYLHKRINFLERGLSIVLQRHQLKGLYLLHRATKEETDQTYQNHKLRVRVNQLMASKAIDQAMANWMKQRSQVKSFINDSLFKKKGKQHQEQIPQTKKQTEVIEKEKEIYRGKVSERKTGIKNVIQQPIIDTSNKLISAQRIGDDESSDNKQEETKELQFQSEYQLDIEPISSEEAENLIRDLTKLHSQATKKGGDPKSKRIYELLDQKMKKIVQQLESSSRIK